MLFQDYTVIRPSSTCTEKRSTFTLATVIPYVTIGYWLNEESEKFN